MSEAYLFDRCIGEEIPCKGLSPTRVPRMYILRCLGRKRVHFSFLKLGRISEYDERFGRFDFDFGSSGRVGECFAGTD